jgi:hypothetical protein
MPRNKLTNKNKRNKKIKKKTIQKGGAAAVARNIPQIEEINEETFNGEWNLPIMSSKYIKSKKSNQSRDVIEKYFTPYAKDRHIIWSFHLMLQREHLYNNGE